MNIYILKINFDAIKKNELLEKYSFLSKIQKTRYKKYKYEKDKILFLYRWYYLNIFLKNKFNIINEQIFYNDFGKPLLMNSNFFFNLSKSNNLIIIGFSENGSIGVDIEECKKIDDNSFYNSILTEDELIYVGNNLERFYKIWTIKEAYLKYLGVGLSKKLLDINVKIFDKIYLFDKGDKILINIISSKIDNYYYSIISCNDFCKENIDIIKL